MKFFSIAIFSLLILFESISAITEAETNLVLVQVMVRHGVRSILREYPNDPHEDYWNKYGRGQLHPVGMKQLQDYGAFIMNRYSSFINSTYDHNRVYARSTNYDRTLQSAGAFLAGAFKPASWQSWTSTDGQSAWIPIPIHTDAFATDPIIGIETTCPRMDQLKDQVKNGPIWKANETQYQAFLDQMKALSGLQSLDVYSIYDLADKYKVQDALGLSQEKYLVDNIDKILMIDAYSYNYDLATQEMARLTSGGLLNYALTNMKSKLNMSSDDANRQLYVYAIHDTYMAGLQKIFYMSSTNFTIPDFASSYVYELRNDTRGNYYVQMLFKNNKAYDPITLNPIAIEGCDVLCPLEKFESLLKGSIATDYKQLCIAQPTNLRETISYYFNQFTSWLQGKI